MLNLNSIHSRTLDGSQKRDHENKGLDSLDQEPRSSIEPKASGLFSRSVWLNPCLGSKAESRMRAWKIAFLRRVNTIARRGARQKCPNHLTRLCKVTNCRVSLLTQASCSIFVVSLGNRSPQTNLDSNSYELNLEQCGLSSCFWRFLLASYAAYVVCHCFPDVDLTDLRALLLALKNQRRRPTFSISMRNV